MSALIATEDSIIRFTMEGSVGSAKLSDLSATISGAYQGNATWKLDLDDKCTILEKKVVIKVKEISINAMPSSGFTHVSDATGSISASTITKVKMSEKTPLAVGDSATASGGVNTQNSSGASISYSFTCEISDAVQTKVSGT